MGVGQSKEESVFFAAQKCDVGAIRKLREEGASLEWVDPKGRTPLAVACSHFEGYATAKVLLELGANVKAYRRGVEGGFPVHFAAKKGLEKILRLLLEYGADLMVANDVGQTPLWLARLHGHPSIVRLIEERLALFCGHMKQVSTLAPGFIQTFAKGLVSNRVWVAVMPSSVDPRVPPQFELAIFPSTTTAIPETSVALSQAQLSIERPQSDDPSLLVEDRVKRMKLKLCGDSASPLPLPAQVHQLFQACRGLPQRTPPPLDRTASAPAPHPPQPPQPPPQRSKVTLAEEEALRAAMEESLRTAAAEEASRGRASTSASTSSAQPQPYQGWEDLVPPPRPGGQKHVHANNAPPRYGGWDTLPAQPAPVAAPTVPAPTVPAPSSSAVRPPNYNGWDVPLPAAPSARPQPRPPVAVAPAPAAAAAPSAPPLPPGSLYPAIETGPVEVPGAEVAEDDDSHLCAVCLNNRKDAVCVPCGHMCCCMDCIGEIRKATNECPVCRAQIREAVRVFQS